MAYPLCGNIAYISAPTATILNRVRNSLLPHLHTESHAVVLDKIYLKPISNKNTLAKIHMVLIQIFTIWSTSSTAIIIMAAKPSLGKASYTEKRLNKIPYRQPLERYRYGDNRCISAFAARLLGLYAESSMGHCHKALLGYEFACLATDTVRFVFNTYKSCLQMLWMNFI